ncbi:uncharacterized protein LOC108235410 [Kryptolebias marmoratus]|uniref:Uncharacterized LOC108235410 n=1 Tax=Kryptolebias marmoratus TaxID=37003 RepID=A0A3Q3A9G5_KRYMA|nr:uncharacterized protein LOC108235410 [Kryptolebias marmoratus]
MLGPAAVRAAAAAVWLLAVLGLGLSQPDEHSSDPGFSLCSDCFYRQTPPQGASAGLQLRPRCHRLPGGQAFATLSRPTCDTAVYTAFHLSHGWIEKGEEIVAEEEVDSVRVPALLRGGGSPSEPDSPLQHWDSTVTALVQSSIIPQCGTSGGDVYVLTGAGRLGAAEDGDEECQMKLLWSAVCCAPPEGKAGFSVGFIRETGEGERQVSMKELEEALGVAELFSEGCGGEEKETAAIRESLSSDELTASAGNTEADTADTTSENTAPDVDEDAEKSREALTTSEQVADDVDAHSEKTDVSDVTEETAAESGTSVSGTDQRHDVHETVSEDDTDSNSTNSLVYILSTTLSIIKAPLRPVISTITELPGQVTYVLQEDLGVLSALPGDTYAVFHLLTSDLLAWMGSASEMLLGVGETCFSSAYFCSSSMLEALLSSCHTGVTGMGTLAGDTVGICGDVLDNAWSVAKFFGGRLWEHTDGYVGSVMSEMGGQAQAVGGGLGKLAWRSGNGVGNVFRLGWGFVMGMVNVVVGGVKEAFGQESE